MFLVSVFRTCLAGASLPVSAALGGTAATVSPPSLLLFEDGRAVSGWALAGWVPLDLQKRDGGLARWRL